MRRFLRIALIVAVGVLGHQLSYAQASLTTSPYTQDFNGLSNATDNSVVSTPVPPTGWSFLETGANLNTTYRPHSGGSNAGDTYSFGASGNTERAFGQIRSGSLIATLGANFQNNTSAPLTSITVAYVGEQWRLGATGRNDKMDFQYSVDATSLATGTWVDVNELDFIAPLASGTVGALDGNATANRVSISFTISGLNISNSGAFWIRWSDVDAAGADDGLAIDDVQLTFNVGDLTAPAFSTSYPQISTYTTSGFDLFSSLNEIGKTYFVVLANNATAPTAAQVKAGQDAGGATLSAGFFGSINNTSASTVFSTTLNGLSQNTEYDLYFVAEDNGFNVQSSAVKIDATTNEVGDITPPQFSSSYPSVSSITSNSFLVKTSLNSLGKTYFIVVAANATAPNSTQVKEGKDASGTLLATNRIGSVVVNNSGTEFSVPFSALSANTGYDIYAVAEDNVPNLQASPVKISLTTTSLFTEAFNDCNGTASFSSFSAKGDQVWGCVDFGYNASKGLRMNGFSSSAVENEDWLISPDLNLSGAANLSFYSQFTFAGNVLQLKISTDYSGTGNPASATWVDLNGNFPTVAVGSTSVALSDWTLSNVDLSAYASQKVFLAFVYTSTSSAAARWTLDEINVSGAAPTYFSVAPSGLTFNKASEVKSYTVKGVNLLNDVSITAPADFTISKDNTAFSSSISFTAIEANANPTVHVKFTGTGTGNYSGSITHTSTGVATKTVSLSGVDKSKTLNVSTYNLEFFGSNVADGTGEFGPVDDVQQVSNVTTVMKTIGSDIFAVEEVSDDASIDQLIAGLPGYSKIMADRWSYSFNPPDPTFPPQKIGFVYNTATVQVISSRVMFAKLFDDVRAAEAVSLSSALALLPNYPSSGGNTPSNFWSSGRLPFMITADVTVNAVKKRIRFIVIHAKSGSAQADYERRKYDVQVLHDSLVARYPNDPIMLMGDFNDDVDASINTGSPSSYKMFVDDVLNFNTLTYTISQAGANSFPSSSSFLDHIIVSNELSTDYVNNSIGVDDPRIYISGYTSNTSDHLPVSARFALTKASQTIAFASIPAKTVGDAAFNLTATASSGLAVTFSTTSDKVTLSGSQVTVVKAGSVTITAAQSGNENFNAAASVDQTFCINPAKPTITLSNINTESPTLTSSATAGNQWYINGTAIPGATNATYAATAAGIYKVQVKADNCLSVFSNDAPLIVTGDIKAMSNAIAVYPNPVEDYLIITGLSIEITECIISDMTGRTAILKLDKQNGTHRADVRNYGAGLYVARVQSGSTLQQIKFIKK